ncbi:MAG: hypothetical protein HY361_04700 [Candidatus Aenigmarchaeota archaeon]|nr:hypothetical protein [Candidatus Aenigmarchaeota archaeon]
MKIRDIIQGFRYTPRRFSGLLKGIGYGSKLGSIAAFVSDVGKKDLGYNFPNIPGDYLVPAAALYTAGQTATIVNEFRNDAEWFKEMPLRSRLPRYIQRTVSFMTPPIALGSLAATHGEVGSVLYATAIAYSLSEWLGRKWAESTEERYLRRHPKVAGKLAELEKTLNELK